jgi:cobalamin biosynthesis Mg chelatase CobN
VSRLVPVLAADGRTVYDPLAPLAESAISIEPQGVEYLWLQHADVAGDGVVNVSVSSPDGWRENLEVVLQTFSDSSVRQELMPDVGVWAYSSDMPVWASAPKSDVVRELRDAGVNVLVVHPDHIPLPGRPESWLQLEKNCCAQICACSRAGVPCSCTSHGMIGWSPP